MWPSFIDLGSENDPMRRANVYRLRFFATGDKLDGQVTRVVYGQSGCISNPPGTKELPLGDTCGTQLLNRRGVRAIAEVVAESDGRVFCCLTTFDYPRRWTLPPRPTFDGPETRPWQCRHLGR